MSDIFDNDILGKEGDEQGEIFPMIFPDDDFERHIQFSDNLPDSLPLLSVKDRVLFPYYIMSIILPVEKAESILEYLSTAPSKDLILTTQNHEGSGENGKYLKTATLGELIRVIEMDDDVTNLIIVGKHRVIIDKISKKDERLFAKYSLSIELSPDEGDMEFKALISTLKDTVLKILVTKNDLPKQILKSIAEIKNPKVFLSFACSTLTASTEERYSLLLISDLKTRAYTLLNNLNTTLQLLEIKDRIHSQTRSALDKQQKDYFLQQQIKMIQEELQDEDVDDEVNDIKNKALKIKWPNKEIYESFKKDLKRLERMNIQSPDYSVQLQYLQTMVSVPWSKTSKDNFNINNAAKVLDKDHYGMEFVKERILEHLSVLRLKGDLRSPIICLYGPPGVGKTSLGKSIAKALNRKYVRISLGGLHDEAEIRGHRRTYIGAMPGRVIKGLIKAGTANPVFVLDEIDKLASDYKGDPSSALLEVLDPEQNDTFHDNYLDIDYDLSKVLFVATANNISSIPGPLRDRMEMIEVGGYILEEKIEIAQRHLIPKTLKSHGLNSKMIKFPKETITAIIRDYTKESGVRELEKKIASVLRKMAKEIATQIDESPESLPKERKVLAEDLQKLLGAAPFTQDIYEGNKYAGVVTGLAWTSVGGEILTVESAISPSKNAKMSITGNLGEVMKESAILALEYVKSHCELYNIPKELFYYWNVHIHVPEGAIPKDGPSAGVTLVTSLISAFTQRKLKSAVAMTGEITLRGKVLPVGGIKEKILAAKRSGIKTIILCSENKKDIDEIKDIYLKGLKFIYVDDILEVIDNALTKSKVESPIDIMQHIKYSEGKRLHKTT